MKKDKAWLTNEIENHKIQKQFKKRGEIKMQINLGDIVIGTIKLIDVDGQVVEVLKELNFEEFQCENGPALKGLTKAAQIELWEQYVKDRYMAVDVQIEIARKIKKRGALDGFRVADPDGAQMVDKIISDTYSW